VIPTKISCSLPGAEVTTSGAHVDHADNVDDEDLFVDLSTNTDAADQLCRRPPVDPRLGLLHGPHLPRSSQGHARTFPTVHAQIAHIDSSRRRSLDVDNGRGPMTVRSTCHSSHTKAKNPSSKSPIDLDTIVSPLK
jgi:hypothetical protein